MSLNTNQGLAVTVPSFTLLSSIETTFSPSTAMVRTATTLNLVLIAVGTMVETVITAIIMAIVTAMVTDRIPVTGATTFPEVGMVDNIAATATPGITTRVGTATQNKQALARNFFISTPFFSFLR